MRCPTPFASSTSSVVGLKVDFDMALLVVASGLYRRIAERMRGYPQAQARQIFRDLIDMPADVTVTAKEVCQFSPSLSPFAHSFGFWLD